MTANVWWILSVTSPLRRNKNKNFVLCVYLSLCVCVFAFVAVCLSFCLYVCLTGWLAVCLSPYVQDWTQLQFLRSFASLKFFNSILVIFATFVNFAVLIEPFQPQIWPNLHIATIFVKYIVLIEPFNKFQLANITIIIRKPFILFT